MRLFQVFLFAFVCVTGPALADTSADYEAAKAAIWAKELAIYDAWSKTGLDYYIEHASQNYVGWPPGGPKPSDLDGLKQMQANFPVPNQDKRRITFESLALENDTAVLYYTTHRTMLPDGTPIDETLHICHVWVRDDTGDWKIIGALGRVVGE